MNIGELNKDSRIKYVVQRLADKFGDRNFKIKDHWEEDCNAIGLVDNEEKYLVYISTYGEDSFYISLENSKSIDDFPYEPAGDFDGLDIEAVERIFSQHLRL